MKEYIKTFMTPNEGDKYNIDNIPWMGYVNSTGQNLVCNKKNKKTINQNGTLVIQDGPEFVDLGLSVKWAKYLYGVNPEQLTSASDWYGKYLSWGELEEKTGWDGQGTKVPYDWTNYTRHTNGTYSTSNKKVFIKYIPTNKPEYWNGVGDPDNLTSLESTDDVASVNYGGSWRIPTKAECEELIALPNQWVTDYNGISGLNGRVFTGTNGNTLFIPAAGWRGSNINYDGFNCYLWSSSLNLDSPNDACRLTFGSGNIIMSSNNRCSGISVLPVFAE